MNERDFVPVYLITGFLESGKTTMIQTMLIDEGFTGGEKILVISCEEGPEEFNPEALRKGNATLVTMEESSELTSEKLLALDKAHAPERVIVEFNSMWPLEMLAVIRLPRGWQLVQVINLADATTLNNYMTNMRRQMTDPMKQADLIMINRCAPDFDKSYWRRQMRAMNPSATILFENPDGTTEDGVTDDDMPYDMKADIIDISEDQFGIFYLDALEHPERYDMKTVRLVGQAFPDERMPKGFFYFGRMAMTCCSNDMQECGWVCRGTITPDESFYLMTAKCQMVTQGGQKSLLLTEEEATSCPPTRSPYFSFQSV